MAKTKTSSTVKNRYNAKAYDQLPVRVPKGRKEQIQAHAAANGESLNGFITVAIDERIERLQGLQEAAGCPVVSESIMRGLQEALDHSKGKVELRTTNHPDIKHDNAKGESEHASV